MNQILLIVTCISLAGSSVICQSDEEGSIIDKIDLLFDAMRSNDSTDIVDIFVKGSTLSTIFTNDEGQVVKRTNPSSRFVSAVGQPHDGLWDEKIWSYDVNTDGPMAYVWTEYSFYLDTRLSHCGVNMFEMMKTADGWKISGITDTRRKTQCVTDPINDIHVLLDDWHKAAASGDEHTYFGSMTKDGVFIGTDASERWLRDELKEWSEEYFAKDSAWSFTPISRNVELGEGADIAWFDELLDTWMGTCRSSGVLVKEGELWKIRHYHLSIAVPNEKVNGYLELIGKEKK